MNLKVFIQNEAGSTQKHYHNEKTLQWRRTEKVSRPHPYPYGFILGTTSADGERFLMVFPAYRDESADPARSSDQHRPELVPRAARARAGGLSSDIHVGTLG